MNDETRRTANELEQTARRSFERVRPHLNSNSEMSLADMDMMMSICKRAADVLRDMAEVKKYYEKHSDKRCLHR